MYEGEVWAGSKKLKVDVEFECGLDLASALARNLGAGTSPISRYQLRAHLTY
jgi:hypothetical protein